MNIRNILLVAFSFFVLHGAGYGQLKLQNIPYDVNSINITDDRGKQGIWYSYDSRNFNVYSMQYFINDTLNGYFERYWPNGKVSEKGYYKNGNLDSTFAAYWENGKERGTAYYNNGSLDGVATLYNQSIKLTTRITYINGIIDSTCASNYIDSNIVWDNTTPIKIDTVVTMYESKLNKKLAIYKNDSLYKEIKFYKDIVSIENFYENLQLIKRVVYFDNKPHNIEKIYHYRNEELYETETFDKKGNLIKKQKSSRNPNESN